MKHILYELLRFIIIKNKVIIEWRKEHCIKRYFTKELVYICFYYYTNKTYVDNNLDFYTFQSRTHEQK